MTKTAVRAPRVRCCGVTRRLQAVLVRPSQDDPLRRLQHPIDDLAVAPILASDSIGADCGFSRRILSQLGIPRSVRTSTAPTSHPSRGGPRDAADRRSSTRISPVVSAVRRSARLNSACSWRTSRPNVATKNARRGTSRRRLGPDEYRTISRAFFTPVAPGGSSITFATVSNEPRGVRPRPGLLKAAAEPGECDRLAHAARLR